MTTNGLQRYFFVFCLLCFMSCGSPTPIPTSEQKAENLRGDRFETRPLRIPSYDGTELAAILFEPKEDHFPGARPGLIMINSWTMPEFEYLMQARAFAQKGYVVLSYATRGFSSSEGTVTVAGSKDLKDVTAMIDWMENNTALDITRLGMAGVSYGAGISLMGLANDPRVKTAAAMSGWGDLQQAIYGQDTIRQVWMSLLIASGKILGRLDPDIEKQARLMRENSDAEGTRLWAAQRSPLTYVDKINARKAPVLVANSYQDGLFPPAQMRNFYEKLQGPKAFYMDKGVHASSSVPGLLGLPSQIWSEAHRWFDYYLLDAPTGITSQGPISMQSPTGREYYTDFPALVSKESITRLKAMNSVADLGNVDPAFAGIQGITFTGSIDSGATSGLPLINDTAEATINLPVTKQLTTIDKRYAALYITDKLAAVTRLRGSPRVKVWTPAYKAPQQMVAYLYDCDPWAKGTLITHGVVSKRSASRLPAEVTIDLNIASYDVPAGHRLVLVIDTRDPLYANYASAQYSVSLIHDGTRFTQLALPIAL